MNLPDLIRRVKPDLTQDLPAVDVLGVQEDSRRVGTGDVFVARQGHGVDGKQFVRDAWRAGAVAVVADAPIDGCPLPVVVVPDAGSAASVMAHAVLGDPTRQLQVLGVTGTNGKTTTSFLLRHLVNAVGKRCGLIGTCEIDDGTVSRTSAMTTPGPVTLAELMAAMRDKGCDAIAMEASSHALHQGRCAGVRFAAGGFINLTGDHLDYHHSMEAYAAAKAELFRGLTTDAVAVVNAADEWSPRMLRHCQARPVRFRVGARDEADYAATDIEARADGTRFTLHTPTGEARVSMKRVGRHNVENALCAAAITGETFGLEAATLADALAEAPGAPGRLEPVEAGQDFAVLIDYAHTDDALDNVLRALRPLTVRRLTVLFGCGGDRDRAKRPRMAAVAEKHADRVIVTSDNPRSEDPGRIIDDILQGFGKRDTVEVEPDRRTAIRRAVAGAREGDVVLLAGKGHETYQLVGDQRLSFDDAAEARRAIVAVADTTA
jgi:UDP-N-acetylmuramoyl-L-alanyl-D-glutamate--2,6-diaminopimelate ligase